ncbi:DUF2939 domain-containing protein [Acinetobacter gandensis]|uniref:DUF2939 domain-containing protein n=1 Tax=Acinetobacter gandensis TaxID=1443941 RepID=A0A1A7R9D3_9GAMM|nr:MULTISPECIES: DUF2939 domain-containing protein [unclassified Acinetobacter]KAB0630176.1 DUF2939 domain-containing protein [Acinetobacter gandensis]OBX28521.1 hypothetical protein A9J31_05490 [Acinetobacter gandensis]
MIKQHRIGVYSLVSAFALTLLIWLASPYWVLFQIHQAYEQNQPEKISKYIDYAAVKSSLKPQIQQWVVQQFALNQMPKFVQKWGMPFSANLSDAAVEVIVNPTSLMLLMQGQAIKDSVNIAELRHLEQLQDWSNSFNKEVIAQEKNQLSPSFTFQPNKTVENLQVGQKPQAIRPTTKYRAWNRFDIEVPVRTAAKNAQFTIFSMQRSGVSWKIVAIQLPHSM